MPLVLKMYAAPSEPRVNPCAGTSTTPWAPTMSWIPSIFFVNDIASVGSAGTLIVSPGSCLRM